MAAPHVPFFHAIIPFLLAGSGFGASAVAVRDGRQLYQVRKHVGRTTQQTHPLVWDLYSPSENLDADRRLSTGCPVCGPLAPVGTMPAELNESSGLVLSLKHKSIFYTIDDSPNYFALFAIRETGEVVGRFNLTGVAFGPNATFGMRGTGDLEAISVGPCELQGQGGSCLFIGDIGQNCVRKSEHCPFLRENGLASVLRFPEPDQLSPTITELHGERFWFRFPEAPHGFDAETMVLDPAGSLFVVTKADDGVSGLYEIESLSPSMEDPVFAKHRATIDLSGEPDKWGRLITDGSIQHPGGKSAGITVLTYKKLFHWSAPNQNVSDAMRLHQACSAVLPEEPTFFEGLAWGEKVEGGIELLVVGEYLAGLIPSPIMKATCTVGAY